MIIEFKVDAKDAQEALQQIQTQNYTQKYQADGRAIHLIGIAFDSKEKNIRDFEVLEAYLL